ncbi:peptidyl-prolyl cis-trans isomerase B (cyclophilin B) [Desulfatibacillum alkenivorans DSM 16219]|jgi:cyclophilin family peptidyl-prolyl cis-trans isomerase|uniref:Peptidyl-prolyl cis-trans isomerase n=1 Tax=Desulfatibacillum alkenivorans DSM 16219 TaxID=1121393 RepID=A0A1M6BU15_9BACT|nr:peptidylprolyl isomerase [Desulfatibacillum alkenivorans]SHI52181.1 peptidyl-prolyl cis-trans isomerase B (cyclophilin B) [Desulfatibacillum alkenivorans DSM 16219]
MKAIRVLCVVLAVLLSLGACTPKDEKAGEAAKADAAVKSEEAAPAQAAPAGPSPEVLVKTSMGEFVVELRPDLTPVTVENFLSYVDEGFYDGKIFHRVIDGFMIQGGGFDADMKQDATRAPIVNEAPKGLENLAGTIAMARTGEIDSATAQFFINVKDNYFLNHVPGNQKKFGYVAFGRVVQGMDVVYRIAKVETGVKGYYRDVPQTPVIIESVTRVGAAD